MRQIEDWRKKRLLTCREARTKNFLHVGTPDDIYCDECMLFRTDDCPNNDDEDL